MHAGRGVMQREQYKRESQKGTISPFSQLKEGHFTATAVKTLPTQ